SGQQSWSASADGAVSFENGKNHDKLFVMKNDREEAKFCFYLSTTENTYFEGYGFIESLSVDLSAEDKGNISISISGNSHVYTENKGEANEKQVEYGLRLYKNGSAA
ncbi:MAG: hypothetical protein LBL66_10530, partial [Clostridiales bacterium]|nr:hypothetical protein [Clostridiales bacterium]